MAKIQIGGAGGAPGNNVIRSLRESGRGDHLIGTSSSATDLFLADVDERHVVPLATSSEYEAWMLSLLSRTKPDFLHVQNDYEVLAVSRLREKIEDMGVRLYLPSKATVENCVNKEKSYQIWQEQGIRVPRTKLLRNEEDLAAAFEEFGAQIWLRAVDGGGGRGALPADDIEFARRWIDRFDGWGAFTAAELLTERTVTWLSLWHDGELVVAQTRRRHGWAFGNRTLSGVTGVTAVGETASDPVVDEVARAAIHAIDAEPHGLFAVDMTYDHDGHPNPTEINIGRFFTTVYFFTRAGLNLPKMYVDIALGGTVPSLSKRLNPLPEGLLWIRGMDVEPVLTTVQELEAMQRC